MISLSKFIPKDLLKSFKQTTCSSLSEIKILPNTKIHSGQIYKLPYNKSSSPSKYLQITKVENGMVYYIFGKDETFEDDQDVTWSEPIEDTEEYIKKGTIVLVKNLSEIKIVPNLANPKEGDRYEINNSNGKYLFKVTSIDSSKNIVYVIIYLDNTVVDHNSFDLNNFKQVMNKQKAVKLNEIKIVPNGHQPQIGEFYKIGKLKQQFKIVNINDSNIVILRKLLGNEQITFDLPQFKQLIRNKSIILVK